MELIAILIQINYSAYSINVWIYIHTHTSQFGKVEHWIFDDIYKLLLIFRCENSMILFFKEDLLIEI